MRGRHSASEVNNAGATAIATRESCQSIRAVTKIIAATMTPAVKNGITPSMTTRWIEGASYCSLNNRSATPFWSA